MRERYGAGVVRTSAGGVMVLRSCRVAPSRGCCGGTAAARGRRCGSALRHRGPAAADRALGEAAVLQQPVVQHQRAGHRQVEREAGRDPHDVAAALQHGRATGRIAPAPAHRRRSADGGTRAGRGVVQQFDPDQHAALRQAQRIEVGKAPERHVVRRVGGVGERPARASKPAPTMKQNAAPKACAVRSRAPTLADFETPSTPMPK